MKKGNKIFAVIDTNVLVSSLFSSTGESKPAKVIEAALRGIFTPLYNSDIIEEYKDVLSRPKFKFNPTLVDDLIDAFVSIGIETPKAVVNEEIFPDKDDIVFFKVTMSVDGAYLITGNTKHFPQTPIVVTPAQFLEIIQERMK